MSIKILVVRLSSLGDVVLTAAVYKNLKACWPDCHISLLVKPQFAAALEGNPHIDEIIPFRSLSSALSKIRASGFTHLLDLHANLRSFLIRRSAGIPNISVYRKNSIARRIYVSLGVSSPGLQKHTVERYLEALKPWGVPAPETSMRLGDYRHPRQANRPAASKILVIQSAFLGDSLLTLPLLRELKNLYPEARLTVLTLPRTAGIFRESPWVDEVIEDRKHGEDGGLLGPWRLASRLKALGFDMAVIPHRSFRSALVAKMAGIFHRIGFDSSAGRFMLTKTVPFTWSMPDLERNLALLLPIAPGLRLRGGESRFLQSTPAADAEIARSLAGEGLGPEEVLVGVHPGSAWETKRWFEDRFAELCRRFAKRGIKVVLVGGAADRKLCGRIAQASGAWDWSGKTDLTALKSVMGRLSLFVTNDSGPMHVATGSAVPTLAIFGPTTRELGFFPYGPGHEVLEADLACRPCGLHGGRSCPRGHFLCMKLITVDAVWERAMTMLSAARPTPRQGAPGA